MAHWDFVIKAFEISGTARKNASKPPPPTHPKPAQNGHVVEVPPSPKIAPRMQQAKAIRLLEDLKSALDTVDDKRALWHKVAPPVRQTLHDWMAQISEHGQVVSPFHIFHQFLRLVKVFFR